MQWRLNSVQDDDLTEGTVDATVDAAFVGYSEAGRPAQENGLDFPDLDGGRL